MDNFTFLKSELFKACMQYVNQRADTVHQIIRSNQNALNSETKSSAGDKHETGRAMLQLEMEKASQQLAVVDEMKVVLSKIAGIKTSEIIKLGSLVITDHANYYLAISAGQIKISNNMFYAVSPISPIGKLLLGKTVGDKFNFNQEIVIKEVY
jgi:transcription elongation GreA/GreB family factor